MEGIGVIIAGLILVGVISTIAVLVYKRRKRLKKTLEEAKEKVKESFDDFLD